MLFIALTVKSVGSAGVLEVVVIVSVAVLLLSVCVNSTGFGLNDADAPAGNGVMILRSAVNTPEDPGPDPRVTVMV
jgi:hypothetical protein